MATKLMKFLDHDVLWSDELVIIPGMLSRFIPKNTGAMDVLNTFEGNTLYFKCNEADIGYHLYSDFFGTIALMYNYKPEVIAIGNDNTNLLH